MTALIVLLAVVAATVIGIAWMRGDGTMKRASGERILPSEVALGDDAFGPHGTFLLFTSDHDTRTPAVRQLLEEAVSLDAGMRIATVDLTRRGDLAGRYAVTVTPSVFVLDGERRLRFRIKGAARREDLLSALASVAPPG